MIFHKNFIAQTPTKSSHGRNELHLVRRVGTSIKWYIKVKESLVLRMLETPFYVLWIYCPLLLFFLSFSFFFFLTQQALLSRQATCTGLPVNIRLPATSVIGGLVPFFQHIILKHIHLEILNCFLEPNQKISGEFN